MAKLHFTPLEPQVALQVVEAVLALDPLGNDNCPFCAHPNRRELDIDLLTNESIAQVVDHHQLASQADRDYGKICLSVERHRRNHVIKVFQSIEDFDSMVPHKTAPTIQFIDWTVGQYVNVYKQCDSPRDQLTTLQGIVKALLTRAQIRGEIRHNKTHSPEVLDAEVLLTPDQKRKMLELEARRLGLKVIDTNPIMIEATKIS